MRQVRFEKVNAIRDGMPPGVSACYRERSRRNVGGKDRRALKLCSKSDRETTGTGADIGNEKAIATGFLPLARSKFAQRQTVQRDLHDVFSFGPRNQNIRSYLELEAPEFLLPGQVLRGLAL